MIDAIPTASTAGGRDVPDPADLPQTRIPGSTVHTATVTCDDGTPLVVRAFEAAAPQPYIVLLAAAAGVPARFYFNFATWLAHHGYTTVVWNWRGIADNGPASARDSAATMSDWATLDQPAVIDWAHGRYAKPIIGVGHSFGGQAFGLAGRPERFARLVLFASGHAYWRLWPSPGRYLFRAAIGLTLAATAVVGYLPGKALGFGVDLPAGVVREWLTWCRSPDYLGRWDGHAMLEAPVLSYGFSDDHFAPPASRQALLEKYGGPGFVLTPSPADFGLRRVGHLDFFRQRFADTLWPAFLPLLAPPSAAPS